MYRQMKKKSIAVNLAVVFFIMLAVGILEPGTIYYHFALNSNGNQIINFAGRQRMIIQMMAKYSLYVADGKQEDAHKLKEAELLYGTTLEALESGGVSPHRPLPASIKKLFAKNKTLWLSFKKQIDVIATKKPGNKDFQEAAAYIKTENEPLMEVSDAITGAFESYFSRQNVRLKFILLGFFAANCLLLFFIVRFVRMLVEPLRALSRASAEIVEKGITQTKYLDFPAPDNEIGELVTSFKEMVKALGETTVSRDFFNTVLMSMREALVVVGRDGKIEIVNEAALGLLEYKREEMVGRPMELIHPEGSFHDELLRELFEKGSVSNVETCYKTRMNEKITVLMGGAVMRNARPDENRVNDGDASGLFENITGIVFIAQDITERKRKDDAIREIARFNELLLDSLPHPAMLINFEDKTILASNKTAKDHGAQPGGYCYHGFGHLESIPEEDQSYFNKFNTPPPGGTKCSFCQADRMLEKGETVGDFEIRLLDRIWSTYWVPIDRDRYLHYAIDITENRLAEIELKRHRDNLESLVRERTSELESAYEILRRSEIRLAEAQQMARLGSWDLDLATNEVSCSDETYHIFGQRPEGFADIYEALLKFGHPDDRGLVDEFVKKVLNEKEHHSMDCRIVLPDGGMRFIHLEGKTHIGENGAPVRISGTVQDLTERLILDEEKKKLEQLLLQSQKMEAVGQLAGGMAHDFNNMLTVILGNANLALCGMERGCIGYSEFEQIIYAVERSRELTMKLLTFARKEKIDVRECSINKIVKNVLGMLERSISKKIKIKAFLDDALSPIIVDENQIVQAILNVCNNARDAMPDGGTLTIETGAAYIDGDYLERGAEIESFHCCLVQVSDTGIGMPDEVARKIFEPFFTTKDAGKGTGLGLSTTYGIIKNHSGLIRVYSEQNKGTTMKIYLPFSEDEEMIKDEDASTKIKCGSETILVVDDELQILEVVNKTLQMAGYRTLTACAGKTAVDIYAERHREIDAVVLDLVMPDLDGKDVFRELKKINPEVKILLSSGYSVNGQAGGLMVEGASGFVQKPFSLTEICDTVRRVLDD